MKPVAASPRRRLSRVRLRTTTTVRPARGTSLQRKRGRRGIVRTGLQEAPCRPRQSANRLREQYAPRRPCALRRPTLYETALLQPKRIHHRTCFHNQAYRITTGPRVSPSTETVTEELSERER